MTMQSTYPPSADSLWKTHPILLHTFFSKNTTKGLYLKNLSATSWPLGVCHRLKQNKQRVHISLGTTKPETPLQRLPCSRCHRGGRTLDAASRNVSSSLTKFDRGQQLLKKLVAQRQTEGRALSYDVGWVSKKQIYQRPVRACSSPLQAIESGLWNSKKQSGKRKSK